MVVEVERRGLADSSAALRPRARICRVSSSL